MTELKEPDQKSHVVQVDAVSSLKVSSLYDFVKPVKEEKTIELVFGPTFLSELDKYLSTLRNMTGSEVWQKVENNVDLSSLDELGKTIQIDDHDHAADSYRFLEAVGELDYLENLENPEDLRFQIEMIHEYGRGQFTNKNIFKRDGDRVVISVNEDDRNLYGLDMLFQEFSADLPKVFIARRIDVVLKTLTDDILGFHPLTNQEKLSFAKEWAVLRVIYGGLKIGLFQLSKVEVSPTGSPSS